MGGCICHCSHVFLSGENWDAKTDLHFLLISVGFPTMQERGTLLFCCSQDCTGKTAIIITSFLIFDFFQVTEPPKMKWYVGTFFLQFLPEMFIFCVSPDLIHRFPTEFRTIGNKLTQGEVGSIQDFWGQQVLDLSLHTTSF